MNGDQPNPRPGFETELIHVLKGVVDELPADTASLTIGRIPGHAEYTEPYFEVVPTNPQAARFNGHAVITDRYLTIGKAGGCEFCGFSQGGQVVGGATGSPRGRVL